MAFERAGLSSGLRRLAAFKKRADFDSFMREHPKLQTVREQLTAFQVGFAPHYADTDLLYDHVRHHWLIREQLLMSALEPVLRRASMESSISAWIGADDEIAEIAARYIASSNKPRLAHLSTYGFDNRIETLGHVDGTYEFNVEAAVHIALESILNPARTEKHLPRFHEIAGTIVERPLRSL